MPTYGPVTSVVVSHAAFGSVAVDVEDVYTEATAAGAIVGGDPLEVAASGTVRRVTVANSTRFVGVAAFDAANGEKVRLYSAKPIFDGVAEGAITAGDQLVVSNVAGRSVKSLAAAALNVDVGASPSEASIEAFNAAINTAVNNARAVIGVALTTAADNATVRWMMK
jgi:hypothetical protein